MGHKKIFFLLICGLIFIGCDSKISASKELSSFVPNTSEVVLKISNLETFQGEISNNEVLSAANTAKWVDILKDKNTLLNFVKPTGGSVLSLSKKNDSLWDYVLATRQDSTVFKLDSIADKSVETLQYDGISIQRVSLNGSNGFTATKDSVFLASSSQRLLQNVVKNPSPISDNFKKAFDVLKNTELTTIVSKPRYRISEETYPLAAYSATDLALTPNGISASGVALTRDSIPNLLSVFEGQIAQQNDLENLIPNTAVRAVSITLSDASLFIENLRKFRNDTLSEKGLELFSTANEIGEIELPEGKAVVLKSIDTEMTHQALGPFLTETGTYRDVNLFQFSKENYFSKRLHPFITADGIQLALQLDDFFVFGQNEAVSQAIISAVKSNTNLSNSDSFESASSLISNASSFLIYGIDDGVSRVLDNALQNNTRNATTTTSLKNYPLALLQYRYDRDFAHIHFVCEEVGNGKSSVAGVSEVFSKTLDNAVMGAPYFLSNHRTGSKNIAVQDIGNTLYLLSENGKTLWTKSLNNAILGEIHEVDLLRNGRKQLAFATKNQLHVVDRNGKDVSPFPINFKDDITQPLSVFDYDNNRKYRFAIVQGKEILLYDSNGKVVKGFTFNKAKSDIVLPAEHIRMGNKDYIALAEESGKLNILSRVGKSRVTVNKNFSFSENRIESEGGKFVVIDVNKQKHSINTNGKVSTQQLNVSDNYFFVTRGSTKVTMDDNLLRINGNLAEIPLGIYTRPQIFIANRRTYIAVTETQEKKVCLFNKNGTMVNGFPIFGSSLASISERNNNLLISVVGQKNEVILFRL